MAYVNFVGFILYFCGHFVPSFGASRLLLSHCALTVSIVPSVDGKGYDLFGVSIESRAERLFYLAHRRVLVATLWIPGTVWRVWVRVVPTCID